MYRDQCSRTSSSHAVFIYCYVLLVTVDELVYVPSAVPTFGNVLRAVTLGPAFSRLPVVQASTPRERRIAKSSHLTKVLVLKAVRVCGNSVWKGTFLPRTMN